MNRIKTGVPVREPVRPTTNGQEDEHNELVAEIEGLLSQVVKRICKAPFNAQTYKKVIKDLKTTRNYFKNLLTALK